MPMEIINIVQRQHINDFLQIIHRKKVPPHIHQKTPVAETRIILYRPGRQRRKRLSLRKGKCLVNRLDTIEHRSFRRPFQCHTPGIYMQFIPFGLDNTLIHFQHNTVLSFRTGSHLHLRATHLFNIGRQKTSRTLQLFIPLRITHRRRRLNHKRSSFRHLLHFLRKRNNLKTSCFHFFLRTGNRPPNQGTHSPSFQIFHHKLFITYIFANIQN